MNLKNAQIIARKYIDILTPVSLHCNIAGSVRRLKPDVKDIEIVCTPLLIESGDLFNSFLVPDKKIYKFAKTFGNVKKGQEGGRYMQIELPEGIMLDLFIPQFTDYWRQFAIRTGSADYSSKVIAKSWVRNGWVGTSEGLRLRIECIDSGTNGSHLWSCVASHPTLPPVWQSEKEFFEWLGIKWLEPQYRSI
jgi:DNA polymerase/3'-5' exonuclease PolX